MAEAAAAKERAEFARLMAEKEKIRRHQEAEEKKIREQQRAQYDRDMAVLAANKAKAVAKARLKAIEESICEEEEEQEFTRGDFVNNGERTLAWVHTQHATTPDHTHGPQARENPPPLTDLPVAPELKVTSPSEDRKRNVQPEDKQFPITNATSSPIISATLKEPTNNVMIQSIMATNQQLVAGLAKQSLPKCQPDVFGGEVTLFHPWKSAFKAMIRDTEVSAEQEMNYLRSYTKGEVQRVVDNFRKRCYGEPASVLKETWQELERRFGNVAAITHALLERLTESARFTEKDKLKLQAFADLCADVDSQLTHLPGLNCYAFKKKSFEEKTKWISEARLCFRCLADKHIAKECNTNIKCDRCGSRHHLALLHMERGIEPTGPNGDIKASCTSVCNGR